MTTETILMAEQKDEFVTDIIEYGTDFVAPLYATVDAIEQAVLQSPELQRLKAIEVAAERVLSMPQEDGYVVLTVHLDALRAAMEQQK